MNSIQALRDIAKKAKEQNIIAPADLSEKHNDYAWG
jgi:hypothetical protein